MDTEIRCLVIEYMCSTISGAYIGQLLSKDIHVFCKKMMVEKINKRVKSYTTFMLNSSPCKESHLNFVKSLNMYINLLGGDELELYDLHLHDPVDEAINAFIDGAKVCYANKILITAFDLDLVVFYDELKFTPMYFPHKNQFDKKRFPHMDIEFLPAEIKNKIMELYTPEIIKSFFSKIQKALSVLREMKRIVGNVLCLILDTGEFIDNL